MGHHWIAGGQSAKIDFIKHGKTCELGGGIGCLGAEERKRDQASGEKRSHEWLRRGRAGVHCHFEDVTSIPIVDRLQTEAQILSTLHIDFNLRPSLARPV